MTSIPKILHYTFGMAENFGGKPWSLIHYVCLKSAVERIKPEKVFLYFEYEPTGPWWTLSKDLVTPIQIRAPREIFGRTLQHVAHRSDVVRLQKLLEHGGIYLDADIFVHRNFDDLLNHCTVLGCEGESAEFGVANAVILARPQSPFLKRWLNEYHSFRSAGKDDYWNEHSVLLPSKLAKANPSEITVLSHKAFYWPLWTPEHLHLIFKSQKPIVDDSVYANHLWESEAWSYLENLTPGRVRTTDSNFHRWARPLLTNLPDQYGASPFTEALSRIKGEVRKKARSAKVKALRTIAAIERRASRFVMNEHDSRRRAFQDVYKWKLWGHDGSSRFFSGLGSGAPAVDYYVDRIAELLEQHSTELGRPLTVVDLGCGDFRVGRALTKRLPELTYIGCDIVPELVAHNNATYSSERVSFQQVDIVCDALPVGDVCLIRQVFQHLSNSDILQVLGRIHYRFIYVSEGHPVERTGRTNPDKVAGGNVRFDWRTGKGRGVELDKPPYNFTTQELFRFTRSANEVIVTERIFRKAQQATA